MSWSVDTIPIKELASGESLNIKTYTYSEGAGPHIYIQASVHGAELQGNAVIVQLMDLLNHTKINGSITFVPLANPYATNNKHGTYTYGRYNPTTGHNWNRNYIDIVQESDFNIKEFAKTNKNLPWHELKLVFKNKLNDIIDQYHGKLLKEKKLSANNKLNITLQKLAANADAILDLHTGPVATRYLYSAEYEKDIAKYLKFKHTLVIPNEFGGAMDEAAFMPWVHLKNELKNLDREVLIDIESFTLEFGSEETFCMENAQKDVESIVNYLKYKGVIAGKPDFIDGVTCELKDFKTIYASQGGLVDFHFSPGEKFSKGDVLASFYHFKNLDPNDPIQSSRRPVYADQDGLIINRCCSSAVHEGMELYQIMTNLKKVAK